MASQSFDNNFIWCGGIRWIKKLNCSEFLVIWILFVSCLPFYCRKCLWVDVDGQFYAAAEYDWNVTEWNGSKKHTIDASNPSSLNWNWNWMKSVRSRSRCRKGNQSSFCWLRSHAQQHSSPTIWMETAIRFRCKHPTYNNHSPDTLGNRQMELPAPPMLPPYPVAFKRRKVSNR